MPAGITFLAPTIFAYTDNKGCVLQQIPNEKNNITNKKQSSKKATFSTLDCLKMFASDS